MSVRRALVDCVVLSLQDACVFYPCCKCCFSRIDVEQQDTTRFRCFKCGYRCLREQADYRYRLSLKVARGGCIFGVTVFGSCLNPFFGIHASALQRLVENLDGPVEASTRSTLLLKAIKDCFIGRHFIFGIKGAKTESWPWLRGPVAGGSSSKGTAHCIASQMILPKASGLGGCTVVSYYRILVQKAAEYELESADPSKTCRPPATTLLLIPHHSPARSFNDGTLCISGLLSQSLQRSQNQDCTLTPTPPWQQSLGLVTSSAEQEEGCSTQDSGGENSRKTDNFSTPHHAQRDCLEDHKVTKETVLSPLLSLECSSYSPPSFAKSIEKAVGTTSILNTSFTPSPLGHNNSNGKGFSTRRLTETFLPNSLAWSDLPFSESLTEFLYEENKDFDIVGETEPHLNGQIQNNTTKNNLEDKNLSIESTSVCQSSTQVTASHSQIFLDIANTPSPNDTMAQCHRCELSDQVCKNPAECVKSQTRNICSHECNREDEKINLLSFEQEEEQQLEGDTYNCSADLFSSSLMNDITTNTLNTHAETVRTITDACPGLSKPDKWHLRIHAYVPNSTPDKQKLKNSECSNRDCLIPADAQELDFIPPSQSTPIVKVAVVSESPTSSYRTLASGEFSSQRYSQDPCASHGNLPELDSKNPTKIISSLNRLNCVRPKQLCHRGKGPTKENQVWSMTPSSHRFTPKRRFWKPGRNRNHLFAQQHLGVQRDSLNTGSTRRINHKYDSSDCDVTVCDYEDSEAIIVPPTPAAKTQLSAKLRGRRQTDNGSSNLGCAQEWQQGDGANCIKTVLHQTLNSSQRGLAQTANCDSEAVFLDASNCYFLDDENETFDGSRDLFSDSV